MSFAQICSILKQNLVCTHMCKTLLQLKPTMFAVISALLPFSFGKEYCQYTTLGLVSTTHFFLVWR